MIAKLVWLLACVFLDAGHCKRWALDPWGLWCAELAPRYSCPRDLEPAGWHEFTFGVQVCTRDCGSNE